MNHDFVIDDLFSGNTTCACQDHWTGYDCSQALVSRQFHSVLHEHSSVSMAERVYRASVFVLLDSRELIANMVFLKFYFHLSILLTRKAFSEMRAEF